MENLDLSNVTSSVSAPFLKVTGDHLNNANTTLGLRSYKDSIPSDWNNSTTIVVLEGCQLNTTVQSGLVFYNGGIYDFENPNALADGYFAIQTSYLGSDPVKYSDNNNYSQHRIIKMILQASSIGSTTVLYSSTSTRWNKLFETDKNYTTNKIVFDQNSIAGNQFQINATNTSNQSAMACMVSNKGVFKGSKKVFAVSVNLTAKRANDASSNPSESCFLTVDLSNVFNQTNIVLEENETTGDDIKRLFCGITRHTTGMLFHAAEVSFNSTTRVLSIPLSSFNDANTAINFSATSGILQIYSEFKVYLLVD